MAKSRWGTAPPAPPSDRAVQALREHRGYEGSASLIDRRGQAVSVAFFANAPQAQGAQLAATAVVSGKAHASASPGARITWINYSGDLAVDRAVGHCAASAGR